MLLNHPLFRDGEEFLKARTSVCVSFYVFFGRNNPSVFLQNGGNAFLIVCKNSSLDIVQFLLNDPRFRDDDAFLLQQDSVWFLCSIR